MGIVVFSGDAQVMTENLKQRILKVEREKHELTCKEGLTRIIADLSTDTLTVKKTWNDVFRVLKDNS